MSTDVLASAMLTATGQVKEATGANDLPRVRIMGYTYVASVAGSITLRDGAGGPVRMTIPVSATNDSIRLPGKGVLFSTSVHATVTGATLTGITFFYA